MVIILLGESFFESRLDQPGQGGFETTSVTESDSADAWTARTRQETGMMIGQWVGQRGMADGEVHDRYLAEEAERREPKYVNVIEKGKYKSNK